MKEYGALIGQAKTFIDAGFSRVGRDLNASSKAERALMLLAARSVAVSNALVLLAQHGLPNESLPLLRSLLEMAAAMRWIIAEDREQRAREYLAECETADWETLWRTQRLTSRLRDLGFPKDFEERAVRLCRDHLHANAQGLPWGHVFEDGKHSGLSSEEVLKIAAFACGHVVKALDARWPGKFEGAETLWEKAK